MRPLFGLASGGVYHATDVTIGAVRSYRTLSALPVLISRESSVIGGLLSAALSVRSLCPGVTRHRISVKPGLSSQPHKCSQAAIRSSDMVITCLFLRFLSSFVLMGRSKQRQEPRCSRLIHLTRQTILSKFFGVKVAVKRRYHINISRKRVITIFRQ